MLVYLWAPFANLQRLLEQTPAERDVGLGHDEDERAILVGNTEREDFRDERTDLSRARLTTPSTNRPSSSSRLYRCVS